MDEVAVVQSAVETTESEREALARAIASMAAKEARVKQHRKVERLMRQLARESGAERIDLIYPHQMANHGLCPCHHNNDGKWNKKAES